MSKQVVVSLIDDLTGEAADETVMFSLDGKRYEIDLTSANAAKLRAALAEYRAVARNSTTRDAVTAGEIMRRHPAVRRRPNQEIRDWARAGGIEVSDRGPIPSGLQAAFSRRDDLAREA